MVERLSWLWRKRMAEPRERPSAREFLRPEDTGKSGGFVKTKSLKEYPGANIETMHRQHQALPELPRRSRRHPLPRARIEQTNERKNSCQKETPGRVPLKASNERDPCPGGPVGKADYLRKPPRQHGCDKTKVRPNFSARAETPGRGGQGCKKQKKDNDFNRGFKRVIGINQGAKGCTPKKKRTNNQKRGISFFIKTATWLK